MKSIRIEQPDGKSRVVECPEDGALDDWLESQDVPLNTRCGGRGLCRGCAVQVVADDDATSRTVKACQTTLRELSGSTTLRIPESSWRDATLTGVSAFEIRIPIPPPVAEPGCGLALDIGTTTVAAAVWEFESGKCLATASRANGQIRYGDNVLSRIGFGIAKQDGVRKLQHALVHDTLLPLLEEVCRTADIDPGAVARANAAGNPAMLHTLVGAPLDGLGTFPFQPAFIARRTVDAASIGLPMKAPLTLLPALGAFVGADIVAGALASGMLPHGPPALLIDFGTNGEMLLKTPDGFLATATAAGPAFEGGRLNCGAAARPGVVASASFAHDQWRLERIQGKGRSATGISGAAYIDILACGRSAGLINPFGRFDRSQPGISRRNIDGKEETCLELDGDLFASEADVAELVQAKAAIGAGFATLLDLAGLDADELDTIFIAGGFGYHLNPLNARAIGLLPDVPVERFEMVGNSSLGGASLLLHAEHQNAIDQLAAECQVVELNQVESFEDHFTDNMQLAPADP